MPPPAFVLCELCHQRFGKHSIGIHMKQCVAKREASTAFCPVCDLLVSNDEYEKHVSECKIVNADQYKAKKAAEAAARAKAPKVVAATGPLAVSGGAVGGHTGASTAKNSAPEAPKRSKIPEHILKKMAEMAEPPETRLMRRLGGPCDACGSAAAVVLCLGCHAVYCSLCSSGIHESNKALAEHTPELKEEMAAANITESVRSAAADLDGRVECGICQRKFGSDRIAKHQLVCTKAATRKDRKPFMSSEEARLKGTDFEKFIKKNGQAKPETKTETTESKWRKQHEEMQQVVSQVKQESGVVEHKEDGPSDAAAAAEVKKTGLRVGDKVVLIEKGVTGVLQFKGPIWGLKKGTWLGVEFHDGPLGRNDGSYLGVNYFYCAPNHGIFIRPEKVRAYVEGEAVSAQSLPVPSFAPPAPRPAAISKMVSDSKESVAGTGESTQAMESKDPLASLEADDDFKIEIHVSPAKNSQRALHTAAPATVSGAHSATTASSMSKDVDAATQPRPSSVSLQTQPPRQATALPATGTERPPSSNAIGKPSVAVERPPSSGTAVKSSMGGPSAARPGVSIPSDSPKQVPSQSSVPPRPSSNQAAARTSISGRVAATKTAASPPTLAQPQAAPTRAASDAVSRPLSSTTGRTPAAAVPGATIAARTAALAGPDSRRAGMPAASATRGAPIKATASSGPAIKQAQPVKATVAATTVATSRGATSRPASGPRAASTGPTSRAGTASSEAGTRPGVVAPTVTKAAPGRLGSTTSTAGKSAEGAPRAAAARVADTSKPSATRAKSTGPVPQRLPPHLAAASAAQVRAAEAARLAAEQASAARAEEVRILEETRVTSKPVAASTVTRSPLSPHVAPAAAAPGKGMEVKQAAMPHRASPVSNLVKPLSPKTSHHASHPADRPPSAGASTPGYDKSIVNRLRKQVEKGRNDDHTSPISVVQPLKEALLAADYEPPSEPSPVRRAPVAPKFEAPKEKTVGELEADARARDIARNVDFLRVLAGEKSRLSDDPTKEKVGYVAFEGGGHRLGGSGVTAVPQTNTTGEKRRVIQDGNIVIAKGLSDMESEREKRAAAARARLARAAESSVT